MSHVQAFIHPSESWGNQIMDNLDAMIWSLALPDLTPLYFNATATQIYQCDREELLANSQLWLEAIATEDQPNMQEAIAQSQASGSSHLNYHLRQPNGEIRWFSVRWKIFKDDSGLPIRLDAIATEISDEVQSVERNITELRQSELSLQELNLELKKRIEQSSTDLRQIEARNLAILHALPDLLLLLKPDGTCLQCIMPSSQDKSKYLPIQHHISEVLDPEDLQAQLRIYETAIATGEVQIYEHQLTKFGKIVYEEVRIAPYCEDELLVIVRDITDRKLVETKLHKTDTHLKTAQRIGKLGSWEFETSTGILTWSDEVFRIYGLEPNTEPPNYAELQQYIHPDDWEHFHTTVQSAIICKQAYDLEHRIIQPNGRLVYVLAKGEMVYDKSGQLTHIIGTAIDITDRKVAEQNLQNLTDRLTLALKSAAIGIWEWDIPNDVLIWDERMYELYGVIPKESPNTFLTWANIVHPDDLAFAESSLQLAIQGKKDFDVEFRIVLSDHSIRYIKAYAITQCNLLGKALRTIGINFDITDRKLAEAALNHSHALREAIFNESTDALFLVDTTTLLTIDCNLPAVKLFEASAKNQLIGIEGHTLQRYQFSDVEIAAINLELATKGFWSQEVEYITCQGKLFWGNLAVKPITIAGITLNLVRVTDISDRKQAEAQILQTSQQLESTNRELESFCYSVSHDLRAPLRHINGFVNALQQRIKKHNALNDPLNDPKVEHYLQVIDQSSHKMGNLIDGLLVLSRYGRKPLEKKQISMRELVDEAIEIVRSDPHHNSRLEFAIGDLPNTVGDPILLQQVFRNLIGNAVKFSRNHPQPRIEINSLPDQTIRIKDNGVGFQMEYADKLFGAFQRLHSEQEFEGTGIGLAIVQRIIQRHGGSIWAEGYPDQGATFFLKL
jgi:PAS domain S-box-containing protein